jgi:hypothetical protein
MWTLNGAGTDRSPAACGTALDEHVPEPELEPEPEFCIGVDAPFPNVPHPFPFPALE